MNSTRQKIRMVIFFTLSILFLAHPLSRCQTEKIQYTKEEILSCYCEIFRGTARGQISDPVNRLFDIARGVIVESKEIKGVKENWALGVRSLPGDIDQATDDQIDQEIQKIDETTGKRPPSLSESVCEWARLLKEDDPPKAHNYARWEVLGNISQLDQSLTTVFYRSLLTQLTDLAEEKIPELTEEEKEEELESTMEETRVCKEGCRFSILEKAISATKPGGTITVEAGRYSVNAVIDKDLVVNGTEQSDTKLEGEKPGHPVLTIGSSAHVKINQLTVQYARETESEESCLNKEQGVPTWKTSTKAVATLIAAKRIA